MTATHDFRAAYAAGRDFTTSGSAGKTWPLSGPQLLAITQVDQCNAIAHNPATGQRAEPVAATSGITPITRSQTPGAMAVFDRWGW